MQRLSQKLLRIKRKKVVSILLAIIILSPGAFPLIGISFTLMLVSVLVLTLLAIILDLISLPNMAFLTRYLRSKILTPLRNLLRKYNLNQAIIGASMFTDAVNFYFTEENSKTVFLQQWNDGFFSIDQG